MRNVLCLFLLLTAGWCRAQSVDTPTVSGAVESGASVSVVDGSGNSLSGKLSLAQDIAVTASGSRISFETALNLLGERVSVFDDSGKLVLQRLVGIGNTIDLPELKKGIYEIRFDSKKWPSFKIAKSQ